MIRYGLPSRHALAACLLALLILPIPRARADQAPARAEKIATIEGITEYRLPNGLKVLLFPDDSTSKVTVNCTVFVGSRHEGYGETGMAHLLEHMVFKGTPTHRDIPRALKDRGATFNGTTWLDRTNYFETLNATDDNLEFAIRLEADRLVNSFIKREDLASEMTVVRSEFEMGENNPQRILSQRLMATAYEWHNYGKSTIGNRSDIERVPIDRLQAFYRKHYQPDNAMVVVAGNFKPARALALIEKYFGAIKKPERALDETYTEEPPQDGERAVTLRRVGSVGVVGAVYHVPAGSHDDFAAIDVLSTLLATGPSSRLYKALVETKKATSVSADAYSLHDPGVLEMIVQVSPGQSVEAVRDALLAVLDQVRSGPITDAEVERAKRKLKKSHNLAMTNSNRIGVSLSEWAAQGDWRLMFLHRDRIARVTAADVQRVAQKYLVPTNRTVGVFLPSKQPQRAHVPPTPDVAAVVKDYKSEGKPIVRGETFDPTVKNIQERVQYSKLPSGVKVAMLPRKTRGEVVSLTLALHYGNADSLKGKTSATQFLATLMARGTKKHSRLELDDDLDGLEARLSAGGLLGDATFSIECKRENLPAVLALLGEVLREPTFPANEFEVLKRQLRNSLEQNRTQPTALAARALQRKLAPYPKEDVRYVPSFEDSIERLEAVTVEQVRQLYEEQLGGENGELAIVGDFDPAPTLKLVTDALKDWKAKTAYKRIERPVPPGIKPGRLPDILTPDKENAFYIAGMLLPVKDTDPEDAPLEVADFLFGGGTLSSRLVNRVRQKEGLSYGVRSTFGADAQDRSARFMMYAICNPKNIDKVDRAMLEEMTKLYKEGVAAEELDEAKKAYLASMKQQRSTDASIASLLLGELHVGRTIEYTADLEKKIAALTPEEVNSAIRRYLDPQKLVIIRAGDFKKKEAP